MIPSQLDPELLPLRVRRNVGLSFDDVLLVPGKGIVNHRSEVDLTTRLNPYHIIRLPIISAPMPSVTEAHMAEAMVELGGAAIIHRFQSISDQMGQWQLAAVGLEQGHPSAIGVSLPIKDGIHRAKALWEVGCRLFCVDVAHGHNARVIEFVQTLHVQMIEWAGDEYYSIIAGNVGTPEGARDLALAGADVIKVGIGPGAACTTRDVTGYGVPQLTAIMEVAEAVGPEVCIIADGGIRSSGDIVKAIAAGADTVMLGRLLAGTDESPLPGYYWGAASKRMNGHRAPEGIEGSVPLTGPVEDMVKGLAWGIRSAVSYAGTNKLDKLSEVAEFIRVAPGVQQETNTRL